MKIRQISEENLSEEEDIYVEESREMLLEDDELSAEEEGFMLGYNMAM